MFLFCSVFLSLLLFILILGVIYSDFGIMIVFAFRVSVRVVRAFYFASSSLFSLFVCVL